MEWKPREARVVLLVGILRVLLGGGTGGEEMREERSGHGPVFFGCLCPERRVRFEPFVYVVNRIEVDPLFCDRLTNNFNPMTNIGKCLIRDVIVRRLVDFEQVVFDFADGEEAARA
jgi:hypothetical protein